MLKYLSAAEVFAEIPTEISLAINITSCPHRCLECHSPELRANIGTELTEENIVKLINEHPYVSCVCLMGGDSDHDDIKRIAEIIHKNNKFTAMYSGDDEIDQELIPYLDYYKIGSYQKDRGPLNKETTNQKLFKIENNQLKDITFKFLKHL